jgi:hypothetical protein
MPPDIMSRPCASRFPLLFLVLFSVSAPSQSTRLYRCEDGNGHVEFRQGLCPAGRQQEVEVEDVRMGWDAPAVEVKVKKRKAPAPSRKTAAGSAKLELKCFKSQQRLESVNRKLRRGYKAGQGADLRHRRRQYEEYLRRFCD